MASGRYMVGSNHPMERLFWATFILSGFICATLLIQKLWHEKRTKPILTTIDSTSVEEVPFPAVTIDSGPVVNPWGYLERAGSLLDMETCHPTFADCYQSNKLHRDWHSYKRSLINIVREGLQDRLKDMRLAQLREVFAAIKGQLKDFFQLDVSHDRLDSYVAALARSLEADEGNSTRTGLKQNITDILNHDLYEVIARSIYPGLADTIHFYGLPYGNFTREVITRTFFSEAAENDPPAEMMSNFEQTYRFILEHLLFLAHAGPTCRDTTYFGYLLSFVSSSTVQRTEGLPLPLHTYLKDVMLRLNPDAAIDISMVELAHLVDPRTARTYPHEHRGYYAQGNCSVWFYGEVWEACYNGTTLHEEFKECCMVNRQFETHIETILRVFKYNEQPTHYLLLEEEFQHDFNQTGEILGYDTHPKLFEDDIFRLNLNPRIFLCNYITEGDEESPKACNLFSRTYTNHGFGYSFNPGNFWEYHKEIPFNQAFARILHPFQLGNSHGIRFNEGSGALYGLHMTLQNNWYMSTYESIYLRKKLTGTFKVAIHSPGSPADMRYSHVEVYPGYESTFLVMPLQYLSADNVRDIDIELRNCKFRDENEDMLVHKDYTQAGCRFECQLREASAQCYCMPWNYPQLYSNTKVCGYYGVKCFNAMMSNNTIVKSCECPPDCESVTYTYSVSQKQMHFDLDKCSFEERLPRPFLMAYYNAVVNADRGIDSWKERLNSWKDFHCQQMWMSMAEVHVQLTSPTVVQMKRDVRVTFVDTLSSFGGTIGLFTGMSLLSVIEILFWLLRIVTGAAGSKAIGDSNKA